MSKRRNEIYKGDSKVQTDARLKAVGELRGGDFYLSPDRVMPAYAARKIVSSIPANASVDALRRALSAWSPTAEAKKYVPPPFKKEHKGEGGFRQ